MRRTAEPLPPIPFREIAGTAAARAPEILRRWLPDGRLEGREWVALNPTRRDRTAGSFRINVLSGRWSDFATKDAGGDLLSLAQYLYGLDAVQAAELLAKITGHPWRPAKHKEAA